MKKHAKKIIAVIAAIALLVPTVAMIFPNAAIAEFPVELAFNNIFVFDKWASNAASTTIVNDGNAVSEKLDIDIENGSIDFNNPYSGEAYTGFSMHPASSNPEVNFNYYMMDVEAGMTYTYSYNLISLTSGIVMTPYIFFFDENGGHIDFTYHSSGATGADSFEFTAPTNAKYAQTRFTVSGTGSATIKDIAIQKKLGSSDTSEGVPARIVYTYKSDENLTYGTLPTPTYAPDGYVFAGWYTGVNGTGELITENTPVKYESITVYAKYEPIVNSISVKTMPVKTSYTVGERVNPTGLVLEAKTSNATVEITDGYRCTPEYLTATGTQTITVYYGGKTTTYTVQVSASASESVVVNGSTVNVSVTNNNYTFDSTVSTGEFNKYVITYSADAYFEGIITYSDGSTEQFFLEPSANFDTNETPKFTSFIDGYLEKVVDGNGATTAINTYTKTGIKSIKFTPLDNKAGTFDLLSFTTSKAGNIASASGVMQYFENSQYKVGIDVLNGGVVAELYVLNDTGDSGNDVVARVYEYMDADSIVRQETKVDYRKNLESGYKSESTNVNLINTFDTGRYLQQSYYGTQEKPYETTYYNNVEWRYNPVQGGNVANEASKVLDYEITDEYIYIKARPLDWSKWSDDHAGKCNHEGHDAHWGDEYVTDTYMEATYIFKDGYIETHCRMVDYSGLPSALASQEMPALYTIEPLSEFVYNDVSADDAWQIQNLKYEAHPEFWGVSQDYIGNHYPNGYNPSINATEGWAAFMAGQAAESFGVGVYSPETTAFTYGCYPPIYNESTGAANYRHATTTNPATEGPTSYMVPHEARMFESYKPTEYSFSLTTGTVENIRDTFGETYYSEAFTAESARTKIAVPETIYMAPSAGQSTTGKYFVNNWLDANGNLQVDANASTQNGYISVYSPGSTAISFNVTAVNGGIGDPVIGNGQVNGSWENTRWDHSVVYGAYHTGAAEDWFLFKELGLAINGAGVTEGGTALLEWEIKVYHGDNDTVGETHYAYTTLYSPWIEPVGAATKAGTGNGTWAQSVAWISGVHGYTANTTSGSYWIAATNQTMSDDGDADKKGTYYAQTVTDTSKDKYAFVPMFNNITTASGTGQEVLYYLTESKPGSGIDSPTIRYSARKASSSKYGILVTDVSPVANLTIDTSRYTNFNQIPNLTVGFNITDKDRTEGVIWYVSDFTAIANSLTAANNTSQGTGTKMFNYNSQQSASDIANKAKNEWFDGNGTGEIIYGSATVNCGSSYGAVTTGVEYYNKTWDREVITGSSTSDYVFKGVSHSHNGSNARAYSINFVQLRTANVNKASLRDLVLLASSLEEKYYTSASWSTFKTALQNAANELGNPTDSDISAAYTNLYNTMSALQTPVTLVANGGSFSGAETKVVNLTCGFDFVVDYTIPAEHNPTLAGHEVQGWATTADATEGTNPVTGGLMPTFYAIWTEGSYTVVYNSNNGYGYIPSVTVKFSEEFNLASTGYTNDGYSMIGWSTSSSATSPDYLPGQTVSGLSGTVGATVTLYAVWAESKYTVVYDANGGEGSIPSKTVTISETFVLPSSGFTRENFTLIGWASNASAITPEYQLGESVNRLAATGTITLYAVWKVEDINVTFDNLIDFKAWNKVAGSGSVSDITDTGMTITCDAGEATSSSPYFPVTPGKDYMIDIDIDGAAWDVYIFFCDANGNWIDFADGPSNRYSNNTTWDHIFTAPNKPEVVKAQIRLDSNGAGTVVKFNNIRVYEHNGNDINVDPANKLVKPEATFGELPVPTKEGYTFTGWYDGNTLITADSKVTQTSTVYLKSAWVVNDSALVEDTVVIDFGTPVEIDPLNNDTIFNKEAEAAKATTAITGFSANGTGAAAATLEGRFGTFTLNGAKVIYTPTKAINEPETVYYHAALKNGDSTVTVKNTITVIPASNILYEENVFVDGTTGKSAWGTVGTAKNNNQDSYPYSGTKAEIYGYDESYSAYSQYSNGSALQSNITQTNNRSEIKMFDFAGSGFDLNGVCGKDTGVLIVSLMNTDTKKMVKSYVIDTYYSDVDGDSKPIYAEKLYQVPIIHEDAIGYGNYRVQIVASWLPSMSSAIKVVQKAETQSVEGFDNMTFSTAAVEDDAELRAALAEIGMEDILNAEEVEVIWFDDNSVLNGGTGANEVADGMMETAGLEDLTLVNVIDSVRVYNPYEVGDLYYIDSEKGAMYFNVMDNLINVDEVNGNPITGNNKYFAYVTGKTFGEIDIDDYKEHGPKDELYLAKADLEKAIAFKIENFVGSNVNVAISLRAASNTPVKVKIGSTDFDVSSNTEMYYDITDCVDETTGTVTIQNITANDALLAIGSVKITGHVMEIASLSSDVDLMTVRTMMMAPSVTVEPNMPDVELEEPTDEPTDDPADNPVDDPADDPVDDNDEAGCWLVRLFKWLVEKFTMIFNAVKSILGF